VKSVPRVNAAATGAGIPAQIPATAHPRRAISLTNQIIRPGEGVRLTAATTLTQSRTLGGVVYRVPTCALIAFSIKGTAQHATD
jgi:hypothetical protein